MKCIVDSYLRRQRRKFYMSLSGEVVPVWLDSMVVGKGPNNVID